MSDTCKMMAWSATCEGLPSHYQMKSILWPQPSWNTGPNVSKAVSPGPLTAAELAAFREDISALDRKVPRRDECTSTDESVNPNPYPAAEGWGDFATDLAFVGRPDTPAEAFAKSVCGVLDGIRNTLIRKNLAYGNSALQPIRICSQADAAEQLRVRIDDKLSRLKQGLPDQEDTVHDLIGYLVLLTIATHKEQ
jgi:hypothetical protein